MSPIKRTSEKVRREKTSYWKIWTKRLHVISLMAQRSTHELHKVTQVTGQKRQALPDATHKMPYLQLD